MNRFSLAAALLASCGLSMIASTAQAQLIDVPFSGTQNDTCLLVAPLGLSVAAALPGTMELDESNTTFSSIDVATGNGTIALFCTNNFTASVDSGTVRMDSATGETVFDVFDPGFNGDLSTNSVTGGLGPNVLTVDLSATTATNEAIAAGEYQFIVPVTITGGL